MIFLQCETPRCGRENNLVLCAVCRELACPLHATHAAGETLCTQCAPATPAAPNDRSVQRELFA